MSEKKNSVKVAIYGEEYPIRGDGDIEYIKEIADYVDKKMREIAEKSHSKSPKDIAVIAALNIANDFFELKKSKDQEFSTLTDRTRSLLEKIESEDLPTSSS
jgi:cell division protein ZapA